MKIIFALLTILVLTGCAQFYPATHEIFEASVYERHGDDVTSATLRIGHDGPLNGDSVTTGSLATRNVTVAGGTHRTFTSATTAWGALLGFLGGVIGTKMVGQ